MAGDLMNKSAPALLEVENLKVEFRLRSTTIEAVNSLSFTIRAGETVGIVGESGSGKSATALSLLRLNPEPPCHYSAGSIRLEGRDLLTMSEEELQRTRGNDIAMIFQDPMTSLNPVMTVGDQIAEAIGQHRKVTRREAMRLAIEALGEVGIANPEGRARQYPHQFSGGMRQRAMIAMAVACRPKVLIADEPTTALDVTVQAQIVEMLKQLQRRHNMAIILITHDLGLLADIADRVLVMYAGRVVEDAPADLLFRNPLMPYTQALLRSVPRLDADPGAEMITIAGQPPDLSRLPTGCSFRARCPHAFEKCAEVAPQLSAVAPSHRAACHLVTPMPETVQ